MNKWSIANMKPGSRRIMYLWEWAENGRQPRGCIVLVACSADDGCERGTIFVGVSRRAEGDRFSKAVGRTIAGNRACRALDRVDWSGIVMPSAVPKLDEALAHIEATKAGDCNSVVISLYDFCATMNVRERGYM